jgi:hypothetical protein
MRKEEITPTKGVTMKKTRAIKIGMFAMTALLILALSWLYFDITGTQQFEREIALLKEQGVLTSLEDLNARIEAAEHSEVDKNVVAYFFGLKEEKFTKPYSVGTVEIFDPKMQTNINDVWGQWSPEVERVLALACKENRGLIEESLAIAQLPEVNRYTWLDTAKSDGLPIFNTPDMHSVMGVTKLLALQAVLRAKTGNPDEALHHVCGTLGLANHMSGNGTLAGLMFSNAIRRNALQTLQKIASEIDFSETAAKEMEGLLLASVRPEDFVRAVETENFYNIYAATNGWAASNTITSGRSGFKSAYDRFSRGVHHRWAATHINIMSRFVEAAHLPFLEAQAQMETIEEEMDQLGSRAVLARMSLAPLRRSHLSATQSDVQLHLARIALALMRFEREQGTYPESLDALTPAYLDTLPDDPFSGSSFLYQKLDKGYVLYSIGENFQDDGPDNESPQSVWRMSR